MDAVPTKTLKFVLNRRIVENDTSTTQTGSVQSVKQRLEEEEAKAREREQEIGIKRAHMQDVFRRRQVANLRLEQQAGVMKTRLMPQKSIMPDLPIVSKLKSPRVRDHVADILPSECSGLLTCVYPSVCHRFIAPEEMGKDPPFPLPETLRKLRVRASEGRDFTSVTPVPRLAPDLFAPQTKPRVSGTFSGVNSPKSRFFVTGGIQ